MAAATHDPLAGMREEASRREQAAANRQILESAGSPPPAGPTAPFSTSNDAALAAHLQQTREQNAEYLRLRTEEARGQYLDAVADNFRRTQAQQQEAGIRGAIQREQTGAQDAAEAERVLSELAALGADPEVANKNPWTAPLDKLRATANTLQKAERLQSLYPQQLQQQPQTRAETFPDGQAVHVTKYQDGTMTVEYATGEKFSGDPLTVTQEIGKAHVSTKLWARQQRAQQPHQTEQTMQLPTALPTEQSPSSGSLAEDLAARQADALARQFGFSDKNEMMQWGETVNQKVARVQDFEDQQLAGAFHANCPDFPDTQEAANALVGIIQANGWTYSLDSLQAAHALAVQRHVYEPLTADQIQQANGITPKVQRMAAPPMLRGNNPEVTNAPPDPYNMPIDELRRQAISQELTRSGQNYR